MKEFLERNLFKVIFAIATIAAVLIVALSISYYFAVYLPKANYAQQLFNRKADCQKYTQSIKDEINKENSDPLAMNTSSFDMRPTD